MKGRGWRGSVRLAKRVCEEGLVVVKRGGEGGGEEGVKRLMKRGGERGGAVGRVVQNER